MIRHYRIVHDKYGGYQAQRRWLFLWWSMINCVHEAQPDGFTHRTLKDAERTINIMELRTEPVIDNDSIVGKVAATYSFGRPIQWCD